MQDLQVLANGDTNYVSKHNGNYEAIKNAVDALEALNEGETSSIITMPTLLAALFGSSVSVIGASSYLPSGASSNLTVAAGYAYVPSLQMVVRKVTSTVISFSGQPAGTYYITLASSGTPQRSTDSTEALYSVVWSGSSFGTITRLAAISWAFTDWQAAQTSTALGSTYETLDARLEAGEGGGSGGGMLTKSVAGGSNVTLSAAEAANGVIRLTGAITADIAVIVPTTGSRTWLVINDTTGNYTITFRTSGTGIKLPPGQTFVYHNGTNVLSAGVRPYRPAILTIPYAASVTIDWAKCDFVRITLTGNITLTFTGAVDGQKCTLELIQDGTGSRTAAFSGVNYGADISSISLSTGANLADKIGFIYDSGDGEYDVVALARGF